MRKLCAKNRIPVYKPNELNITVEETKHKPVTSTFQEVFFMTFEWPHQKTNNLHLRKQRCRSAVQS